MAIWLSADQKDASTIVYETLEKCLKGRRLGLFCPFLFPENWIEGVMAGVQAVILFNEKTPHDEDDGREAWAPVDPGASLPPLSCIYTKQKSASLLDFSVSIVAFIFSILSKHIKNVGAVFPISTLTMHIFKRINGHISTNKKRK